MTDTPRPLVDELTGALRFIMAFYEPGQTYLDTNAWLVAEAGGRSALAKGEAFLTAQAAIAEQEASQSLRSGNGGEVRVKALEWLSGYGVEAEYAEPVTDIRYSVHRDDHNGGWVLFTGNAAREGNKHRAASRDEAKAAAQADFETRILSALDIKP